MCNVSQDDPSNYSHAELDEDFSNSIDVLRCLLPKRHQAIIFEIERLYGVARENHLIDQHR